MFRVREEVERKVKDGARHRLAIHQHVVFPQVPSAGAHHHDGPPALQAGTGGSKSRGAGGIQPGQGTSAEDGVLQFAACCSATSM